MRLRVATYNVRGFRAGVEGVAAAVGPLRVDVLLVQESGPRRALAGFASALDMTAAGDPWSPLRRRVKNAVLARAPWRLAGSRLVRFGRSRLWYPRGVLIASVTDGRRRLSAVSTHLGVDGAERGRHARRLVELADDLPPPVVLGGDLNATPDLRAPATIARSFPDAWTLAGRGDGPTFPAGAPTARIDYVFVSPAVEVARVAVVDASGSSDHLPVVADLEIAG